MFLLAKSEIKMLLLSILIFELNHKHWERIADGKEGGTGQTFRPICYHFFIKFGTFFSDFILGSRHG